MLGIAELIIIGLIIEYIFRCIKLPGFIGVLLFGLLISPYGFGLISDSVLNNSDAFRTFALVIIVLRAGLQINYFSLKKLRTTSFFLSFLPGLSEALTITFLAPLFFPLTYIESALVGFIISAVSPAVIVPMMIDYQNRGLGEDKGIPTMILASSTIDDIIAILIFSVLIGVYFEGYNLFYTLAYGFTIPIFLGIIIGLCLGACVNKLINFFRIRTTQQVLIILSLSIIMIYLEKSGFIFSSLMAIVILGFSINHKNLRIANILEKKLSQIWIFASIILFVMIGAQTDFRFALNMGWPAFVLIFSGLFVRSLVVLLILSKSILSMRERFFVVFSFWPKATVQAALGAMPLMMMIYLGMSTKPGEIILAISVLSILITAPLGAVVISLTADKFLNYGKRIS